MKSPEIKSRRISGLICASMWILKCLEEATEVEMRAAEAGKSVPGAPWGFL